MGRKGRRRVVFCSAWKNAGESADEIAVFFWLQTGPQTTGHGIQQFTIREGAAWTNLDPDRFEEVLEIAVARHGWTWLPEWGVLWIPSWWQWNMPDNPNQLLGSMTGFDRWPQFPFAAEFVRVGAEALRGKTREVFLDRVRETWGETLVANVTGKVAAKVKPNLDANLSPNLEGKVCLNREHRTRNIDITNTGKPVLVCSEAAESDEDFRLSADASEPPEPPVLVFETKGKEKTWGLYPTEIARLEECFPDLDVLSLCRKAKGWTESNPTRKKTAGGMPKFLFGWMSRAQDRGEGRKDDPKQQPAEDDTLLGINFDKLGA